MALIVIRAKALISFQYALGYLKQHYTRRNALAAMVTYNHLENLRELGDMENPHEALRELCCHLHGATVYFADRCKNSCEYDYDYARFVSNEALDVIRTTLLPHVPIPEGTTYDPVPAVYEMSAKVLMAVQEWVDHCEALCDDTYTSEHAKRAFFTPPNEYLFAGLFCLRAVVEHGNVLGASSASYSRFLADMRDTLPPVVSWFQEESYRFRGLMITLIPMLNMAHEIEEAMIAMKKAPCQVRANCRVIQDRALACLSSLMAHVEMWHEHQMISIELQSGE